MIIGNTNSQNISGSIIYKYDIVQIENSDKQFNQTVVNKFYKNLKENSKNIEYKLSFNYNNSIYGIVKNLSLDKSKNLEYAELITGSKEVIFIDAVKNVSLRKVDMLGDIFIITGNPKKKWILQQTSKLIGKYTCYKAILKNDHEKVTNQEITAWYTPEIPISFGPKGYGNLPGIILELRVGPVIYKATKIKINKDLKIDIKKPTKGIMISEFEFNKFLEGIDRNKKRN